MLVPILYSSAYLIDRVRFTLLWACDGCACEEQKAHSWLLETISSASQNISVIWIYAYSLQ